MIRRSLIDRNPADMLGRVERIRTTCNRDCPDACGVIATVEGGRVLAIQGDPAHPVTRGFLCYRTSRFLERQYDSSRLTSPLIRRAGRLRPASWDDALDLVAEKMLRIKSEAGAAAILHYKSAAWDCSPRDTWACLYFELLRDVLAHAIGGHKIIGIVRIFGFYVFRNTYKPLLSKMW